MKKLFASFVLALFACSVFADCGSPANCQDNTKYNNGLPVGQILGMPVGTSGTIFTQTNTVTYANSTAETSLIGTGIGAVTLPANFWQPGRQIRVKGRGFYSSATLAPSIVLKSKFGSSVLATATVSNLLNSASNAGFSFEELITCRSVGSSGTLQVDGVLSFSTGTGLLGAAYLVNTSPATIDTTSSQAVITTGTWGTASASNHPERHQREY